MVTSRAVVNRFAGRRADGHVLAAVGLRHACARLFWAVEEPSAERLFVGKLRRGKVAVDVREVTKQGELRAEDAAHPPAHLWLREDSSAAGCGHERAR